MAADLTAYTPARVAQGRTGRSLPTAELLRFQLDHARARDAVHRALDPGALPAPHIVLHSQARDGAEYLRRPDLGRRLRDEAALAPGDYDVAIILADGLSALAVERHAAPLLDELLPRLEARIAPLVVALRARVALGDEIGARLGARMTLMLIGERPGLTSPDSLGAYLTWDPRPGRHDAERNCISNIRAEGLSYAMAAHKIHFLITHARARKLTGVALKEDAAPLESFPEIPHP